MRDKHFTIRLCQVGCWWWSLVVKRLFPVCLFLVLFHLCEVMHEVVCGYSCLLCNHCTWDCVSLLITGWYFVCITRFASTMWTICLYYPGQKSETGTQAKQGACMLDRSRACATCARGCLDFFLARVVVHFWLWVSSVICLIEDPHFSPPPPPLSLSLHVQFCLSCQAFFTFQLVASVVVLILLETV